MNTPMIRSLVFRLGGIMGGIGVIAAVTVVEWITISNFAWIAKPIARTILIPDGTTVLNRVIVIILLLGVPSACGGLAVHAVSRNKSGTPLLAGVAGASWVALGAILPLGNGWLCSLQVDFIAMAIAGIAPAIGVCGILSRFARGELMEYTNSH